MEERLVKWEMKKMAVMINGLSAPIKEDYFLAKWLEEKGYEVMRVEPILFESVENVVSEPELILGWSMGGLLVPSLAVKYPKARLILMATGPKVNPKEMAVKVLYKMVEKDWGVKLLNVCLKLPKKVLMDGYEQMNRIPDIKVRELYRQQMADNIELFRSFSEKQIRGLIKFLKETDNSEVLKEISNPTLIFCGQKDKLMPVADSLKLKGLIKNSELVMTEGGHYNVVSERELPIIEKFLE